MNRLVRKNCHVFVGIIFGALGLIACQGEERGLSGDALTRVRATVEALSSSEMEGRETGTLGEIKASQWIDSVMSSISLTAMGDSGSFQYFQYKPHPPMQVHGNGDSLQLGMALVREIEGRNVIYASPSKSAKWGVVGAHFDHLGYGDENSLFRGEPTIHNGADDNASGVAGLIEIANRLKSEGLNRSTLFMAFSGEEKGLWGSNYFCEHPTVPIEDVEYMINFDMIGRMRGDTLAVYGTGTSPIWMEVLNACNSDSLIFVPSESGVGPSDHTSFYLEDIPVLHFFTGQHPDYHKPTDTPEKINYEGIIKVVGLVERVIRRLDRMEELAFTPTKDQDEKSTPRFNVTLGVIPDYLYSGKGMRIDGVSDDRPAAIAGLKKGDVVLKIDTLEIQDMMSYMSALSQFEPQQSSRVLIARSGEEREFVVIWD